MRIISKMFILFHNCYRLCICFSAENICMNFVVARFGEVFEIIFYCVWSFVIRSNVCIDLNIFINNKSITTFGC